MALRALVCTDGSESSRVTSRVAARLARSLRLELTLAHVLNLRKLEYKMIPDFQLEMIRQGAKTAAEELLRQEAEFLREQGVRVEPRLLVGDTGPAVCDLAQKGADLMFLGRRGHGDLQDILFGSVSNYVVHHASTPVLVVKKQGPISDAEAGRRPIRLLVGVDGSAAGDRCLDFLARLAGSTDQVEVTLLHVVNPDRPGLEHLPPEARYDALQTMHRDAAALLEAAAKRLAAAGCPTVTRVEEGSAGRTLCRVYQEDRFDVAVLGRRGAGELADILFGTACHYVLHHCPGHTLVVP